MWSQRRIWQLVDLPLDETPPRSRARAVKDREDATPSRVMTALEVAEYLKVHRTTVYKLARSGQIPAFKIGSDYRFNRDEIEKWIIDQHVKG